MDQLYWREYYYYLTTHFPKTLAGQILKGQGKNETFRREYLNLTWDDNEEWFQAWCNGRTGYPVVDAIMTQLNTENWISNRGRMVVASFLCTDLYLDWTKGERYFAEKLVDYDPALNNGGWQWSAGTGCDAVGCARQFYKNSGSGCNAME